MSVYVEGMGVATGIAFDSEHNLYVGDRSGTIFKISPGRQIFVFATLEPSISAYHLTFGPDGYLYVTGPTTSSFDAVYRISHEGEVETFYRGLGRPQGMAFDEEGRLYVAASIAGRKGVVRIYPDRRADLFLSGPGIVGAAFTRRAPWWWPPPTRSIGWIVGIKGGLSSNERRDHRDRQRDAQRRSRRYQLAIPHRGVE
jgi:hypothetical protein